MNIGAVLDPQGWDRWEEAKALLEPARRRGPATEVIEPGEALWIVLDGNDMLAACTARITENGCEVALVGGRDHRRWIKQLDHTLGAAASAVGAARMVALGRRGWLRELTRLGWAQLGEADGMIVYSREL